MNSRGLMTQTDRSSLFQPRSNLKNIENYLKRGEKTSVMCRRVRMVKVIPSWTLGPI